MRVLVLLCLGLVSLTRSEATVTSIRHNDGLAALRGDGSPTSTSAGSPSDRMIAVVRRHPKKGISLGKLASAVYGTNSISTRNKARTLAATDRVKSAIRKMTDGNYYPRTTAKRGGAPSARGKAGPAVLEALRGRTSPMFARDIVVAAMKAHAGVTAGAVHQQLSKLVAQKKVVQLGDSRPYKYKLATSTEGTFSSFTS